MGRLVKQQVRNVDVNLKNDNGVCKMYSFAIFILFSFKRADVNGHLKLFLQMTLSIKTVS